MFKSFGGTFYLRVVCKVNLLGQIILVDIILVEKKMEVPQWYQSYWRLLAEWADDPGFLLIKN